MWRQRKNDSDQVYNMQSWNNYCFLWHRIFSWTTIWNQSIPFNAQICLCVHFKTFSLLCKYKFTALTKTFWSWFLLFPHWTFPPPIFHSLLQRPLSVWEMTTVSFITLWVFWGLAVMNRNVNHFQYNYLDNNLGSVELECATENICNPFTLLPAKRLS